MPAGGTNFGVVRSPHRPPAHRDVVIARVDSSSPSHDEKLVLLTRLSAELGFTMVRDVKLAKYLAHAILKRLQTRGENFLYQSAAFNIPNFPRSYAQKIFPEQSVTENSEKVQTWRLESMLEVANIFGPIFGLTRKMASGCLRGKPAPPDEPLIHASHLGTAMAEVKLPSERVVRVVSSMISPVEQISWVETEKGFDNLYLNFNFILMDEHGEIHAPKDQVSWFCQH